MRVIALGMPAARARRGSWIDLAVVAGVVAVLALAGANASEARRRMRALPPEQRAALYAHTMADLRAFCGDGRTGALRDHCRALAEVVVQLDECRGDCETLARDQLVLRPTR